MKLFLFGLYAVVVAGLVSVQVCGQSPSQEFVAILKNAGSSVELRSQTARSLGKLGKKAREVVPDLAVIVTNSGTPKPVRIEVAKALSKIGSRPAVDALIDVLTN